MNNPAKKDKPGPDMSGVKDDLQRALEARRRADQPRPEQAEDSEDDATKPRRHDTTDDQDTPASRKPAGRIKAPRVTDARAMTVRMEPTEADDVDRFILDLRDETGGQRLDKAEVVRELLRLAQFDPSVRRKLVRRLR